ncbi:MAG TPA: iron-sulfur cluster biosynthesis family protein [Nitrospiraceae bacterium]|nr:iron-sulfur cluster biosynthesis family protein [Nitrospiraceae bacterium]
MIVVTAAAQARLQQLLHEHPEERLVRITITDMDETRLAMSLTLESEPQTDDEVQEVNGLTIAIPQNNVARLDGVTLDYSESDNFRFHHPNPPTRDLRVISLN